MNDPTPTDPYQPITVKADAANHPSRIGRYRIEQILGQGGFGVVYRAYDEQLDRPVAIKVPHSHRVATSEDAQAYLTEARTVASLDHPNIVPVHDVGSTEQYPCFIVSKYIEGSTLAHQIKKDRPALRETVDVIATVAETLHYAHRKRVVHRDIKPSNILLDRSGKPFVADFGLALREEEIGKGPCYAGTPAYMSPEQARGEGHRVDGRSDIFSLGVVLYELLIGQRPFHADSREELLDQIANREVRPPRQLNDRIPKELERICLKALSKRASERYTTAKDMADDLRHFLSAAPADDKSAVTGRPRPEGEAASTLLLPPPPPSGQHVVKIVPKGLRSFDAADADFFLELLPGPRDRDGLPDSIRFWKRRIETLDADETFAVGLIYGPSGCGKSSLVKAGLLPRLPPSVTTVYVEATGAEAEARLLKGLRRQVAELPSDWGLVDSLAALRQGRFREAGRKVLLVLDQFEQWLHARRTDETTELVQALRQCDGGHVQSLVLVRDDFGMAATRFMAALDIPIVQGNNFATVDLFDLLHARKVLGAFGRAYGRLPDNLSRCTKEENAFLDQAIAGLAQDSKVISVRLALFAEMVKGKPWTPATLKEVGGTAGVGVALLEEAFSAPTANPQHRLHQNAARAVLKALLPEAGTNIKGHMRSHAELLAASGYANRPRAFDDLLRILDGELRLITPTDPASEPEEEPSPADAAGEQYYQLTHDYLVQSLRDWLTRKQKETWRGRAELLLADRAAEWNARPENRRLPSLRQWLLCRWLTRPKDWTPTERKLMRRATQYHSIRGLAAAVLLLLVGLGAWQGYGRLQARHLCDHLMVANTVEVPDILADMTPYRHWVDPLLREAYAQAEKENDPRKLLHASLALLASDSRQAPYLYQRLLAADPHELKLIRGVLAPHKNEFVLSLWSELTDGKNPSRRFRAACALAEYDKDDPQYSKYGPFLVRHLVDENALLLSYWKELLEPAGGHLLAALAVAVEDNRWGDAQRRTLSDLYRGFSAGRANAFAPLEGRLAATDDRGGERVDRAKRQANIAAALAALDRGDKVWPLLIHREDPTVRSYLIERLGAAGVDPRLLQSRLEKESNDSIRRALVLALGAFPAEQLASLEPLLLDLFENDPDPGLHAAAGWLLRHCGQEEKLKPIIQRLATGQVEGRRGWYINKQGQTFTILRKPPGPGKRADDALPCFAIASTEVTMAQFRHFRNEHKIDERVGPASACPVNRVSWEDAAAYCNWLSEREGISPDQWCYVCKNGKWQVAPGYEKLTGYRLPTEAEWEHACLAGAETGWSCGEVDEELIGRYARWYGNAQDKGVNRTFPVATLKPNDFGLFDMHGNVSEWCQDVAANHVEDLRQQAQASRPPAKLESLAIVRGGHYGLSYLYTRYNMLGVMYRDLPVPFEGLRLARGLWQVEGSPARQKPK